MGVDEDVLTIRLVEDHACAVDGLLLFDHLSRVDIKS